MLPPFLTGLAGKLIIGGIIIAGAIMYYYHTQNKILTLENNNQTLKTNNGVLDNTVKKQQDTINKLKEDYAKIEKSKEIVEVEKKKNEKKVIKLEKKLTETKTGKKRDINIIAQRKPKLFEKIINNASKQRARCLEIATGSPVTEKDTKNRVCPDLVKPNAE